MIHNFILRKSLQELIKKRPEQAEDVQRIISQVTKSLDSILEEENDKDEDDDEEDKKDQSKKSYQNNN